MIHFSARPRGSRQRETVDPDTLLILDGTERFSHVTTRVAAQGIAKEGFRVGEGKHGTGVYLLPPEGTWAAWRPSTTPAHVFKLRWHADRTDLRVLRVRFNPGAKLLIVAKDTPNLYAEVLRRLHGHVEGNARYDAVGWYGAESVMWAALAEHGIAGLLLTDDIFDQDEVLVRAPSQLHIVRTQVQEGSRNGGFDPVLQAEFKALQDAQRGDETTHAGAPESMFHPHANPGARHSHNFQWMMEHAGDLVHRAAYPESRGGGWSYGVGAVVEKTRKLLRELRSPYFERERRPDLEARRNWAYLRSARGKREAPDEAKRLAKTAEIFIDQMNGAGLRYAEAYAALRPLVRTPLQAHGLEAAVALGHQDWTAFRRELEWIERNLPIDDDAAKVVYHQRLVGPRSHG